MSYEGFSQYLCKEGHYWTADAYEGYFDDDYSPTCPKCGLKAVWENGVDITNGSFDKDEDGKEVRIDGYVELEEKTRKECDKCHSLLELTFEIPKGKGRKVK